MSAMLSVLLLVLSAWLAQEPAPLDFEFFRARVQPIFLAKRPGHARCISCHTAQTPMRLQPLAPGSTTWNEEQSRRNFDAVAREVVPGEPLRSRLLLHSLAIEAGGDRFHNGGRRWASQDDPEWQILAAWVRHLALTAPLMAADNGKVRIIQTNSAGDNVHIIDPATNKIVGEIKDIEVNHGAAASPDGSRIYVSNEADSTLDVVDVKTLTVIKKIRLKGHPNNISIGKDGGRVYVAIAESPGAVDIIDTASLTLVNIVQIEGAGHNTYVTPDGKYVVAGSIAGRSITVIDAPNEVPVWSMTFDRGVRPIAFEANPDGSTKRVFVQLSDFHGFAVVDFKARKEIARITLPDPPGVEKNLDGIQGSPSHGIGITPDGKTLWATSKWYGYVFAYSMPDLKLLGGVPVGMDPDWLTFTPDSKAVYVACAGSNWVSAVDVKTMKPIARIPVGQVPKRNITALLQ